MATTVFPKPSATIDTKKADKVPNATEGNFAGLDENGNLVDLEVSPDNFPEIDTDGKMKISQLPIFSIVNGVLNVEYYREVED